MATIRDIVKCMYYDGWFDYMSHDGREDAIKYIYSHDEKFEYLYMFKRNRHGKLIATGKYCLEDITKEKVLYLVQAYREVSTCLCYYEYCPERDKAIEEYESKKFTHSTDHRVFTMFLWNLGDFIGIGLILTLFLFFACKI